MNKTDFKWRESHPEIHDSDRLRVGNVFVSLGRKWSLRMKPEMLETLERMFKNFASWGLGSLVGAGCVAFLMLMFPHAIPNSLPTTTNLYLGAFVGLACHRVVDVIVKRLTPRNPAVLKVGENIDKKEP
jgi:hypothetical protein